MGISERVTWEVACDNDCGVLTTVSGHWDCDKVLKYLRTYGWQANPVDASRALEGVAVICPECIAAHGTVERAGAPVCPDC